MTATQYGIRYSSGLVGTGYSRDGALRLVADALSRSGLKRDDRYTPAPVSVVCREVGNWRELPDDGESRGEL